jgi:D-proline reductase (dithiol) PrdB
MDKQLARLEDIPINERKMVMELDCSGFEHRRPWVKGPPLHERRVAIVSTAALTVRGDDVFQRDGADYRIIPGDVHPADLVMSHISVNFDRTGFQQDVDICFPLQRLRELEGEGVIGSVADFHYTVSGAIDPLNLEGSARDIARHMKAEKVDTVLLVPI